MEGVILNLNKDELRVLINESVNEALRGFEQERARSDRFAHLPKYLSKRDVAKLFDVHVNTVNNWARDGLLEKVKMGKTVRFEKDVIIGHILNGGLSKYQRVR